MSKEEIEVFQDKYENLFYEKDITNDGKGEVKTEDLYEWDRAKSNDNVKSHGFSFYLARLVFDDTFVYPFAEGSSATGSFEWSGFVPGQKDMMLVVEAEQSNNKEHTRIISVYYSNKHLKRYLARKRNRKQAWELHGRGHLSESDLIISGVKTYRELQEYLRRNRIDG